MNNTSPTPPSTTIAQRAASSADDLVSRLSGISARLQQVIERGAGADIPSEAANAGGGPLRGTGVLYFTVDVISEAHGAVDRIITQLNVLDDLI